MFNGRPPIIAFIVLVGFIINIVTGAPAFAAEKKSLDIVLLIDKSGSMGQSDPEALRCEAAKLFVNLCSPEDRISIVEFGTGAKQVFPLSGCQPQTKAEICKSIDKIQETSHDKFTHIHRALEEALKVLKKDSFSSPNRIPVVILLTDGNLDVKDIGPVESAMASIELMLNEFKANKVRIISIGLGKSFDRELLNRISNECGNGFVYESENPEFLVSAFRKIFLDISSRFLLSIDMDDSKANYKYPVTRNEGDMVLLVAAKEKVKSGQKLITDKKLSVGPAPIAGDKMSVVEGKLYEIVRVMNPGAAVIDIAIQLYKKMKFEFIIIKNVSLDISIVSPSASNEYFQGDRIPLELKIYRTDGFSMSELKIKAQAMVARPEGLPLEIDLAQNGETFASSFDALQPGSYKVHFMATLFENGVEFKNIKSLNLEVKEKDGLKLVKLEPSRAVYTRGSKAAVLVRVLRNGFDVPEGVDEAVVTAKLSVNKLAAAEIKLAKNAEGLYEGSFNLENEGQAEISIDVNSRKCLSDSLTCKFDVIDRPSLSIESPQNAKIYDTGAIQARVRLDLGKYPSGETFVIKGELFRDDKKVEIPIDFKSSEKDRQLYVCDLGIVEEGAYKLKASTTVAGAALVSEPAEFFVYRIARPSISLKAGSVSTAVPVKIISVFKPEGACARDYDLYALVRKPNRKTVKLPLKDDGQAQVSGDDKAGDGSFSAIFKETSRVGDYSFTVVADYRGLKVPEAFRQAASKTLTLGIKYMLDVEYAEKTIKMMPNGSAASFFDIGVMRPRNDGTGYFTVKVKVPEAKKYKVVFSTEKSGRDAKLFYAYSGKRLEKFNDKLNSLNNEYNFRFALTTMMNGKLVSEPVTMSFIDENGNRFSETFYVTGKAYVPFSAMVVLIPVLIVLFFVFRWLALDFQRFGFDVELLDGNNFRNDARDPGYIEKHLIIKPYFPLWKKRFYLGFKIDIDPKKPDTLKFEDRYSHLKIYCGDILNNKWYLYYNTEKISQGREYYRVPGKEEETDFSYGNSTEIVDGLEIHLGVNNILKFTKV